MSGPRLARAVLSGLIVVGLVLLLVALQQSADELDQATWPTWPAVVGAVVLAFGGQVLFGLAWDRLLPTVGDHIGLAWAFHGSQPAKYVPVGVGQPVGQVGLLRELDLGIGIAGGLMAWVSQVLTMVAAGLVLGAGLVLVVHDEGWRWLALLGLVAGPLLVVRGVQVRVLTGAQRFSSRVPEPTVVPPQASLVEAAGLAALGLVAHGCAFALLAGEGDRPRLVLAYALATAVSVATPLPAGLGVREALIVATSGLAAPEALAAALLLRVVLLGVEATLFSVTWVLRRRRSPAPSGGAGPASSGAAPPGTTTR